MRVKGYFANQCVLGVVKGMRGLYSQVLLRIKNNGISNKIIQFFTHIIHSWIDGQL